MCTYTHLHTDSHNSVRIKLNCFHSLPSPLSFFSFCIFFYSSNVYTYSFHVMYKLSVCLRCTFDLIIIFIHSLSGRFVDFDLQYHCHHRHHRHIHVVYANIHIYSFIFTFMYCTKKSTHTIFPFSLFFSHFIIKSCG